jgi:hypothetical protein
MARHATLALVVLAGVFLGSAVQAQNNFCCVCQESTCVMSNCIFVWEIAANSTACDTFARVSVRPPADAHS